MFDIGFSEMIVIAVIALIVLGPEKLPRVARTAGHLLGRMQRYVNDVKADINREIELDELRKLQKEMQSTAQSIEQTVRGEFNAVENELKAVGDTAQKALADVRDPIADAFADPQPLTPATPPAAPAAPAATAATQLELGLDAALPNAPPPPLPSAQAAGATPPKA
jgi:sec-independent protein translocase protein TatB